MSGPCRQCEFTATLRRFDSFAHVNQQLEQWIADVADRRELRQFSETPEQRFAQEQEHLQPLPDTDFDTSYFDIRHVTWDGYIEVRGNRYSVPEVLCGQPVSIRITLCSGQAKPDTFLKDSCSYRTGDIPPFEV